MSYKSNFCCDIFWIHHSLATLHGTLSSKLLDLIIRIRHTFPRHLVYTALVLLINLEPHIVVIVLERILDAELQDGLGGVLFRVSDAELLELLEVLHREFLDGVHVLAVFFRATLRGRHRTEGLPQVLFDEIDDRVVFSVERVLVLDGRVAPVQLGVVVDAALDAHLEPEPGLAVHLEDLDVRIVLVFFLDPRPDPVLEIDAVLAEGVEVLRHDAFPLGERRPVPERDIRIFVAGVHHGGRNPECRGQEADAAAGGNHFSNPRLFSLYAVQPQRSRCVPDL